MAGVLGGLSVGVAEVVEASSGLAAIGLVSTVALVIAPKLARYAAQFFRRSL